MLVTSSKCLSQVRVFWGGYFGALAQTWSSNQQAWEQLELHDDCCHQHCYLVRSSRCYKQSWFSSFTCQTIHVGPRRFYSINTNDTILNKIASRIGQPWTCFKCNHQNNQFEIKGYNDSTHEQKKNTDFFCEKCKALRSAESLTFNQNNAADVYRLFNLNPIEFDFSVNHLESEYRQLQKLLHPDKFSAESEIEKRHASHWSSIVSLAYSTLKDPLARGRLVLSHLMKHQSTHWTQRNHLNLSESQTSDERNENVDDPELLFEILALEERIDEIKSSADAEKMCSELVRENHQSLSKLAEAFRQLDILQAKNLLQRCQMVNRVIKKLNYWNLESEVKTPDQ